MRKTWPFALAVVVVGALAGVAIAGRPEQVDPFVLDPSVTVPIDASSTSEPAATTTTSLVTTATVVSTTTTVAAPTTAAIPTTTTTTTSTTEAPTTTETVTTTTIAGPLPRDQVRLVLANGDGRFRLASITAERISPLGYIIDLGDALQTVDATIIYYRPGFDDEAVVVANDIGVPGAIIAAFPNAALSITNSDDRGDVIVVLGPDAPR